MTRDEEVVKQAAENLAGWVQFIQLCQLRLRCAEIVYTTGSQDQKKKLDVEAERILNFALGGGNPEEVLKKFGISTENKK